MPGIEVTANNPLGITVAGPGYGSPYASPSYGGTGTITSGAGYTFDTFPNQQEGIAAGIQYITNKIQSGAVTTAGQLVNLFSPNDQTAFDQTTGLTPTSVLSASSAGIYAAGIAAGEGTLQEFGGTSAFTGSNLNTGSASVNVGIPGATVTLPSAGGRRGCLQFGNRDRIDHRRYRRLSGRADHRPLWRQHDAHRRARSQWTRDRDRRGDGSRG